MNEILNNPIVQKGLTKLGEGLEAGTIEWVKYIQTRSLMNAFYDVAMLTIIVALVLKFTKFLKAEIAKTMTPHDRCEVYVVLTVMWFVAVIIIMILVDSLFSNLTGYYAPIGKAVDELIRAAGTKGK